METCLFLKTKFLSEQAQAKAKQSKASILRVTNESRQKCLQQLTGCQSIVYAWSGVRTYTRAQTFIVTLY